MKTDILLIKQREVTRLLQNINHQLILIKGLGENSKVFLNQFKAAFLMDMKPLVEESLKPLEPRTAKKILKQLAEDGDLTPELLDEIRRSFKN